MPTSTVYRWRKVTDTYREFAIFELFADEKLILGVGYSDVGIFEVVFNADITGFALAWAILQELIEEGRNLANSDR
jgi:hypothetical protein